MHAKQSERHAAPRVSASPGLEKADDYLIPLRDVMARTGMGRTYIYAEIAAESFPAPVKNGFASRWSSDEINAWVVARLAARKSAPVSGPTAGHPAGA